MTYRVLFVDDEPNVTEGLKRALRNEPFEILTAVSAAEGLSLLAQEPIDVVVADEKIPGMSGSEFLAQVRRDYPDTIRMILTGHATLEAAILAINEGRIYRFFTKPCNAADLAITIRRALEHKEAVAQAQRLMEVVKRQSYELERLERLYPGITKVNRDAEGAIILEDQPQDVPR